MEFWEIIRGMWGEQIDCVVRLFLAFVMGGIVGFERKNRNKVAGIRTHAIVAFGAALIMILSKYGFGDVEKYDASRIASQIVSGIGFLGAGIIFVKNNTFISGLTTAAGLWSTAGVGMCVGAGMYSIAAASTIMLVGFQEIMHRIPFLSKESLRINIEVTVQNTETAVEELQSNIRKMNIEIDKIEIYKMCDSSMKVVLAVVLPLSLEKDEFISSLIRKQSIISVKC